MVGFYKMKMNEPQTSFSREFIGETSVSDLITGRGLKKKKFHYIHDTDNKFFFKVKNCSVFYVT